VIDAAFRAAGVSKPVRNTQDVRSNEIMDAVADVTAIKATGWKPAVTFDQGMRAMVAAARVRLAASHERGA
jgi:nucleoside-diphosphate-sugar epimerase